MWKTVKLGDVLKTGAGGTPLKSNKNYYEGGNIKWLLSGAVCEKEINDSKTHITEDGLSNSSAKLFPKNTVLIAMYGATAGQVGILRTEAATNQAVCGIYPSKDYLPEFLYYYLSNYKETLLLEVSGVAQPNLSQVKIKNIPLPCITLAEQQRIVAKLDAAFAEIDKAIELQNRKIQTTNKIFENYLSKLFFEDNKSWEKASLKEISTKIGSGATPKGGQSSYKDEGISLIRSMNVHDLRMVLKDLAKIDDAQAAKLSNVSVKENDVLLNITGASVARCALVDKDILPARVNQHVSIIRVKEESINPKLLSYMLVSKFYKDKLLAVGEGGGSTRQAITKKQIEEFEVTYPNTVEEQELLVTMLDELYTQSQKLVLIYKQQYQHTSALKNAILVQELSPSEAA